ncbi:MAG TPA: hypothetical protein VK338_04465 [Candidatus Nitrosocosmicus sp.]|nr:hypothetical protein [Candidatus Nitrosocosmicus sp.]
MSNGTPEGDNQGIYEQQQPETLQFKPGQEIPLYPSLPALLDPRNSVPFVEQFPIEGIGTVQVSIGRPSLLRVSDEKRVFHTPTGGKELKGMMEENDVEYVPREDRPYSVNAHLLSKFPERVKIELRWRNDETKQDERYAAALYWREDEYTPGEVVTAVTENWRSEDQPHGEPARPVFFSKDKPETLTEGRIRIVVDEREEELDRLDERNKRIANHSEEMAGTFDEITQAHRDAGNPQHLVESTEAIAGSSIISDKMWFILSRQSLTKLSNLKRLWYNYRYDRNVTYTIFPSRRSHGYS